MSEKIGYDAGFDPCPVCGVVHEANENHEETNPFAKYIDKAERYLEEGKDLSQADAFTHTQNRAQNMLLGSIAASLIALAKKN